MEEPAHERLELDAVPMALHALEELLQFASLEALRAVSECIQDSDFTGAENEPHSKGRTRFAPLSWRSARRPLEAIAGGSSDRPASMGPKAMTSRFILTVAQWSWRLAYDTKVHAALANKACVSLATSTGQESLLPSDEDRAELADLALVFVACALVSDAVRDMRVGLQQDTSRPWFKSSNSKILWSVYVSNAGAGLNAGAARAAKKLTDGSPLPHIPGRGSPGILNARQYDEAVTSALAQSVERVTFDWCRSSPGLIDVSNRARHWSEAVLTQVHIWLGRSDRKEHKRNDTPW